MIESNEIRLGNYLLDRFNEVEELNYIDTINWLEDDYSGILLTEEWLLKFGFENWGKGKLYSNEYETYDRFVLHNVLDGTSNFEVHYIKSTYGNTEHYQYVISCDEDDRLNWGEDINRVHKLQNLYFSLTNQELTIKPTTNEKH